nr:MAG TPA_asm: werner helicase-interacting protein 1-like protein [Bacteriophage sp.]
MCPICDNRNHLYMLIYSPILRILVVLQQTGK